MTKDYMKAATMKGYTAFDIHYCAFKRGQERRIEKMLRRKARRTYKISLKKCLTF